MSQDILTITEAASFQIKDMMKEHEEENAYLRVNVNGGGCSGLSYGMGFDDDQQNTDQVLHINGLKVVVDSDSSKYLNGLEIDFKESLRQRVALLEGTCASVLEKVKSKITFTPGVKQLTKILKYLGCKLAVVSGILLY